MSRAWPVLGTQSTAEQDADGTWTIRGVPVFAETRRVVAGKVFVADRRWLRRAVARAASAYARDGYLARLHVYHHGDRDRPAPAGFVMPVEVVRRRVGGRPAWVLLADLTSVPDAVYRAIRAHEMPYRSAEVPLDGTPELLSVALLPTERPFHRLPPLTVARERRPVVAETGSLTPSAGLVPYAGPGDVLRFTARLDDMATKTKPDDAPAAPPADPALPFQDDDAGGNGLAALDAKLDRIVALLERLLADGNGEGETEPEPVAEEIVASSATPPAAPPAEAAPDLARLTAERDALRSKVAALAAERRREKAVAAAAAKLARFDVGKPAHEACAEAYAKFGGEKGLDAYVAGVLLGGTPDPDADWTAEEDEAAKAARSATEGDAAFVAEYDALPAHLRGGMTKEEWTDVARRRPARLPLNGS